MKALVQRIARAEVSVDHEVSGSAGKGLIVYLGVCETDGDMLCEKMASKLLNLRIFTDAQGKMNLSVQDIGGDILLISQFHSLCGHEEGQQAFVQSGDGTRRGTHIVRAGHRASSAIRTSCGNWCIRSPYDGRICE